MCVRGVAQFGDAEVHDLNCLLFTILIGRKDNDIIGFEITVKYAPAMGCGDPGTDVAHQRKDTFWGQAAFTPQELAQRNTLYQFHHDVSGRVILACLAIVINRNDIWVAQLRGGTCLATETFNQIAIGDEFPQQNFDCHLVANMDAARAIDHTHAAFA